MLQQQKCVQQQHQRSNNNETLPPLTTQYTTRNHVARTNVAEDQQLAAQRITREQHVAAAPLSVLEQHAGLAAVTREDDHSWPLPDAAAESLKTNARECAATQSSMLPRYVDAQLKNVNNADGAYSRNQVAAPIMPDRSEISAIRVDAAKVLHLHAVAVSHSGECSNKMLPAQNVEKTIDFNRRRRRGRLRYHLKWAVAEAVAAVAENVAYRSAFMLSLLLSFIVDYVYIKSLELSKVINATGAAKAATACRAASTKGSSNCCLKFYIKRIIAYLTCCDCNVNCFAAARTKTPKPPQTSVQIASATKTKTTIFASSLSHATVTTAATLKLSLRRCSSSKSGSMQLLYAFMLCASILLPCSNNFVSGAKPKSATQLQKQHLQHQQQEQAAPQHVAGVAYDANGGLLTPPSYQVVSSQTSNEEAEFLYPSSQSEERLFDEEEQDLNDVDEEQENAAYETQSIGSNDTHLEQANVTKTPLFPKDLFTKEQLENGAVAFHIIGVIYMFVALAIVCDEFFVPSLDVIIEKLDITDDVAGATFMAAGGSAPELFTSVIGVFISFDDVGIGTIVGSAVFNILFVIGMCALFSKTVLTLTWWPLFRDCSFYSISLLVLICFFRDNFIWWWEALILFSIYIAYVTFMKWNVQVERCVKKLITKNKGNAANSSETSMATQPGGSVTSRAASETRSGPPGPSSGGAGGATGNSSGGTAGSTHTGAKFRHGLLQLMIHTIDPLHDGKVDEKATQLHAIASLKVLLDATKPQRGGATTSAANHVKINLKETTLADRPNGNIDTTLDSANDIEDEPEPLSMAWPDTARKRLTYVLVAPLLIPMWLTLPDTRTPRGKKYFPVTFIGSILWIAAFSYLMVWWANVAGDTARIPPEVMGLTFLAAGTSIPDLITSVIVARKGFGDMAVSSSVGSNIFDVTVGLPIPWLIFGIIYDAPVEVNSVGMVCSITILFMMLVFVVLSIACFRWRMNKGLGFTMFLLYFVFVAVSLMFEYDMISCPV